MQETDQRRIAIVDDDESIRRAVDNLLQSLGFCVESFPSAETFLQSAHLADTSCLVLDLRMPGMQGLELLAHLTDAGQRIPTVILTAHGDDEARKRALQIGAIAFLRKPFRSDVLIGAVKSAMSST
jgi:FixJ family two-component response regulator